MWIMKLLPIFMQFFALLLPRTMRPLGLQFLHTYPITLPNRDITVRGGRPIEDVFPYDQLTISQQLDRYFVVGWSFAMMNDIEISIWKLAELQDDPPEVQLGRANVEIGESATLRR